MRKRIAAIFLTTLLTANLAACGGRSGPADAQDGTETEAGEAVGEQTAAAEEASAASDGAAEDGSADGPRFTVVTDTIETEDTYTPAGEDGEAAEPFPYGRVQYPAFEVPGETKSAYPALADALEEWSAGRAEDSLEMLAESWNMGAAMADEEYVFFRSPNYDDCTTEVHRADDRAVSVLLTTESYYNGVHPTTWYASFFLDTQSGEFLPLSDVVTDMFSLPEAIWENLTSIDGEYDFTDDRESVFPTIEQYVSDGELVWTMDDEGFHAYFNAYDLMYYAFGPIFADLSYEDYPDLFVEKYLPAGAETPPDGRIAYRSGKTTRYSEETLAAYGAGLERDEADGDGDVFVIECPDWDVPYLADGIFDTLTESLLNLDEVDRETSDWLDSDAWLKRNGIAQPGTFYGYDYNSMTDDGYWYYTDNTDETSLRLEVYNPIWEKDVGIYDFSEYLNTPTPGNEFTDLEIPCAKLEDGVLYVEIAHRTYSADQPCTGFIVAVEADTGRLLWRSEMRVANGHNFIVVDDYIVCGYGFTAEDDYLYILSRHSGAVLEKRKLKTAPDYFILDYSVPLETKLYVLTYNTAYTYHVTYG